MNEDMAQIVEGLGQQDEVVARPSREVVEGMKVRVLSWRAKAEDSALPMHRDRGGA
jgi:hypothetical protein